MLICNRVIRVPVWMVEVCANLDQELLSVVNEMKKELGFETL